ncbi:hypothetical protein SAMN04515624_11960 [Eubacterium maltosivorans]|uniref:hypothetical protein n=1 Tax=Eubacterium TaxID=1730 RepID=UPI0008891A30|nr:MULTISPECIES: hypothetical protein [Eubacterium]MDO5433516.1 hypothetical protein [Eubacterium sp.]WPK81523.1 hypothetical protein EUMA32_29780 [Eubacterium maltosivorans]SDP63610.1 hypothetical protein SAMN04515624_11960 [Eubacterium maltosivorans]
MEGKGYLKFSGIILVICGIVGIVLAVIGFAGGGLFTASSAANGGDEGAMTLGFFAIIGSVMLLITAIFDLVFGIIAVKNCENQLKAKQLFIMGIILIIFAALSLITNFSSGTASIVGGVISLVIAVIYCYGAKKNMQ